MKECAIFGGRKSLLDGARHAHAGEMVILVVGGLPGAGGGIELRGCSR